LPPLDPRPRLLVRPRRASVISSGAALALRWGAGDAPVNSPGGAGTRRLDQRRQPVLPPTRPTGLADGTAPFPSHRVRPSFCPGPSRALTEPLRVLYRGRVARDRRGATMASPGGTGALLTLATTLLLSAPGATGFSRTAGAFGLRSFSYIRHQHPNTACVHEAGVGRGWAAL